MRELSEAQEASLAADPRLLLVGLLVLSHSSVEKIVETTG